MQGTSTDPEKLGPRAAEVDGKPMLQLLRDCSGAFRPGTLTALVGSSGAGKTTLMDVLAGRKTSAALPAPAPLFSPNINKILRVLRPSCVMHNLGQAHYQDWYTPQHKVVRLVLESLTCNLYLSRVCSW